MANFALRPPRSGSYGSNGFPKSLVPRMLKSAETMGVIKNGGISGIFFHHCGKFLSMFELNIVLVSSEQYLLIMLYFLR